MRIRQTARKSTSARDPATARRIAAQERLLDGLARVNDLNGINEAIHNGNLARYLDEDNQANPVMQPIHEAVLLAARDNHRVTSGRNGRLMPQPRTRQIARKNTGPDSRPRQNHPLPQVSSTTETRSKQVRKRPDEEVSPGGTRQARPPNGPVLQPPVNDAAGDDEAGPSTSTRVISRSTGPARQPDGPVAENNGVGE